MRCASSSQATASRLRQQQRGASSRSTLLLLTRPATTTWTAAAPRRLSTQVQAAAGGGDGAAGDGGAPQNPGDDQPQAVPLARPVPAIGYTFVLAGFLKIMTMGALVAGAPQDAVRTAAGRYSQFLLVPLGLLMCWVAKLVVDANLQENNKFLGFMVAGLAFLYFAIYKLLFRVSIPLDSPRARPAVNNYPLAEVRARAGDRSILQRPEEYDGQEQQRVARLDRAPEAVRRPRGTARVGMGLEE